MIKVLHFYKTSLPESIGGVEKFIDQLARGVNQLGVQSDVLSLTAGKGGNKIVMQGYTVHQAHLNFQIASTGFSVAAIFDFMRLIKAADIVHYHFPWPFMDVVHFLARVKKPRVVTYHADIVKQKYLLKLYRPLMHKFLDSVDTIVATSPNYLASSKVLAQHQKKVSVIAIGLETDKQVIPSQDTIHAWANRFGPRYFLFVGVLRYYKGLHILLEAARGIDYPIVIVGDGPLAQELRATIIKENLHHVHLIGAVGDADKNAILMGCYGFVFPSHVRSEAFGLALLEASMHGKPMISCEIGSGTSYVNIKDETGLVIAPSDPSALRSAMQYLWNNPEQAIKMGQAAKERFTENFTATMMAKRYTDLYKKLLARS